jgi:arylformamidase
MLLGNNVIIVEGLDLSHVDPGPYELICLPIRIACDGAPCRAVLMPATS